MRRLSICVDSSVNKYRGMLDDWYDIFWLFCDASFTRLTSFISFASLAVRVEEKMRCITFFWKFHDRLYQQSCELIFGITWKGIFGKFSSHFMYRFSHDRVAYFITPSASSLLSFKYSRKTLVAVIQLRHGLCTESHSWFIVLMSSLLRVKLLL